MSLTNKVGRARHSVRAGVEPFTTFAAGRGLPALPVWRNCLSRRNPNFVSRSPSKRGAGGAKRRERGAFGKWPRSFALVKSGPPLPTRFPTSRRRWRSLPASSVVWFINVIIAIIFVPRFLPLSPGRHWVVSAAPGTASPYVVRGRRCNRRPCRFYCPVRPANPVRF
jgi:hypothetical protein